MLKKSLVILAIIFLLTPANTFAQSCQGEEELLTCMFVANENCRASVEGCEGNLKQGITVQDIVENAANSCCSRSSAKKIRKCLVRYRKRLTQGLKRSPAAIKPLMRASRSEVKTLQSNGCSTGTLGDL